MANYKKLVNDVCNIVDKQLGDTEVDKISDDELCAVALEGAIEVAMALNQRDLISLLDYMNESDFTAPVDNIRGGT